MEFQAELAAQNNTARIDAMNKQIQQFKDQAQRRFMAVEQEVSECLDGRLAAVYVLAHLSRCRGRGKQWRACLWHPRCRTIGV